MENLDLEPIKKDIENFIYSNQEVSITSNDEYLKAGDMLKWVKNKIDKVEEQRKNWTKPLDEAKKRIMEDVKKVIQPLENFSELVRLKMTEFYCEEKKRKDKEQAEIDANALKDLKEKGQSEVEVAVVNDLKTQKGEMSTTTMKKVWKFEIIDETKIPREYLEVDEVKIRSAVKGGIREIEGIKIYQDEQLSIR